MAHPGPAGNVDPDDRRKHLDYIQANVTRMATASSAVKGWLLPVVTAADGYALTKRVESVAWLGVAAVLLFAFLDANYLRQEKAYRRLYEAVVGNVPGVPAFSMNPSDADGPALLPVSFWRKCVNGVGRWIPGWRVWLSWSIAPFYGGFVVIGVVIVVVVR